MGETSLVELKKDTSQQQIPSIQVSMDTTGGFEAMQRIAKLFASSDIVPVTFKGKIADCFIAVDMAMRLKANPMSIMQNLYIVHGRPAWSSQFLIATMNKSGRFSSLKYEFSGKENTDPWGCCAVATELSTGERLKGPFVSIDISKKEGWYGKNGSKWQTMPQLMLMYRAASWFVRAYAPEIAMGLQTKEEIDDAIVDMVKDGDGKFAEVTIEDMKNSKPMESTSQTSDVVGYEQSQKDDIRLQFPNSLRNKKEVDELCALQSQFPQFFDAIIKSRGFPDSVLSIQNVIKDINMMVDGSNT